MPNIETDVLDYKAAGKRDFFAEHLWILIQDSRALVLPPVHSEVVQSHSFTTHYWDKKPPTTLERCNKE